ncbi:MAG: DNA (cytosine-5-)-methyltransferase [Oscillospiraceae bacterium]|nr:DNA (cytosine-5-)-methyltransferase [Oscillospiraceae bacterium]
MIKYIDLFAGIGGIRLGTINALNRLGINSECVLSSEIDKKACQTYELNFKEYPSGDIRQITTIPYFDLLLAGFPCQPFSYAGKRRGFGDTRGTLFFEIERLLELYRPKAFLLENVRGLKTHDGGRTFETIISKLQNLGYGTTELILNSSNFGVPQNRVRLYILGILGYTPKTSIISDVGAPDSHSYKHSITQISLFDYEQAKQCCLVEDILENDVSEIYYCSESFTKQLHKVVGDDLSTLHGYRLIDYRGGKALHSWELGKKGDCSAEEIDFMNLLIQNRRRHDFGTEKDGKKLTLEQIKTFYPNKNVEIIISSLIEKGYLKNQNGKYSPVCGNMSFEVFKFLDPKSIAITLTSSDSNRLGVIQNNKPRRITPRECARLQGFPDTFIINPEDESAYKQFGNSVSVPVIEAVLYDFVVNNNDILKWN